MGLHAGGTVYITLSTDIGELSRDLRSMADNLDQPIRDALGRGAESVVSTAHELMRYRPEGAWKGSSGARYGHIRDYYVAKVNRLSASINSSHPASGVWEFGGQIHPLLGESHHMLSYRNRQYKQARARLSPDLQRPPYTFDIPAEHPVATAAESKEQDIARALADAVDRLIAEYGFDR